MMFSGKLTGDGRRLDHEPASGPKELNMKNRGSSLTSVVLAVAAAVGVGAGGYFLLGGCDSCTTGEDAAAATAVALEEGESCCAVEGEAAVIETVAADVKEGDCCSAEGAVKEVALEGDCCAEGEVAKDECCMAGDVNAETVALEGEACETACEEKTDCTEKTDCETECEDKAAEELTDAGTDESSNG